MFSVSSLKLNTIEWLGEWLSQSGNDRSDMTKRLTKEMIADMKHLQATASTHPSVLYRGSNSKGYKKYTTDTVYSASYSPDMAQNFGDVVYEINVTPENILLDTSLFSAKELTHVLGAFPEELEVILHPGTYNVNMVNEQHG